MTAACWAWKSCPEKTGRDYCKHYQEAIKRKYKAPLFGDFDSVDVENKMTLSKCSRLRINTDETQLLSSLIETLDPTTCA